MQDRFEGLSETGQSLSIQEYGDMFRRRRLVIIQVFAFVLIIGVLITMVQAPIYRATSRLLVSPPSYVINNVSTDPLAALFQLSQQYSPLTQVQMIQRSEIKNEVAARLGQKSLPSIAIDVVEATSIIEVTVEGDNASLVRDTANTLVDVYTENVKTLGESSLRQAALFASDQASVNNADALQALKELQKLKKDKQLPDLLSNRAAQQQIVTDLQIAYNTSRAASIEAQRKIETSRERLKTIPTTKSDIPTPEADPSVQVLQVKIDELETELTAIGTTLGANADSVVVKNRQLEELRKRLVEYRKTTPTRTARFNPSYLALNERIIQLEVDALASTTRAAGVAESLKSAEARLNQFPLWENYYQRLESRIKSSQDRSKYWADQAQNIELRLKTISSNIRPIERALLPTVPIRPKKQQNIILAAFVGIVLGFALALLIELLDDRVNSPEDSERVLRLPNLGHVPLVEELGLRLIRDISSFSPLMESYRSLRTNLNFAAVGHEVNVLLITSSVPSEGKSTTAANLAMAMALDGKRVIIVDADLRRPSQHKLFKLESSPGLTDLLVGSHRIEDVVKPTNVENVWLVSAGSPPPNPAELLGSVAMQRILESLKGQADIILLDTPPTLLLSDTIVLSSLADGILLVVSYGDTKKASVRRTVDLLRRGGTPVLGTVLNRMSGPGGGYYYYYGYGYGYGYGKYYIPGTIETPAAAGPADTTPGDTPVDSISSGTEAK